MGDIITFKSFYTIEAAIEFAQLLSEKGVPNRIKSNSWKVEDPLLENFHVQIDEDDFVKVENILENVK